MPFCPNCGKEVAVGVAFCPFCGASQTGQAAGMSSAGMSSQMPGTGTAPAPEQRAAEAAGLTKVMWFGILGLIGIGVGWVLAGYVFSNVFTSVTGLNLGPNPTPAQVSTALGPIFQDLGALIPAVIVVELAALVVLALGFRDLARADHSRFQIPWVLTIVMAIGVLAAGTGVSLAIGQVPTLISQAPTASNTVFASIMAPLIGDFALLGLGGLLGLIGLIGGQILGLWRVGSKYDQTIIKVGAILAIIPVLSIIAPLLVLIGAYQAKGRLAKP